LLYCPCSFNRRKQAVGDDAVAVNFNRERNMNKSQGFTLIELIAVIAILAILAATAIPQFVDLRVQAKQAAANGIGGALSSAASLNYAKKIATGTASPIANCFALTTITQLGGATITSTTTPTGSGYGLDATAALTSGTVGSCLLYYDDGSSVTSVSFGAMGS
jgi:MSHA pilin protein MshA